MVQQVHVFVLHPCAAGEHDGAIHGPHHAHVGTVGGLFVMGHVLSSSTLGVARGQGGVASNEHSQLPHRVMIP